jgi:hypothetical protein
MRRTPNLLLTATSKKLTHVIGSPDGNLIKIHPEDTAIKPYLSKKLKVVRTLLAARLCLG